MNRLLIKYLNSVATFEAPNDKGAPDPKALIEEQRKSIKVESIDDPWKNDKEEEKENDVEENEENEDDDEKKDEIEKKELTAEEKLQAKEDRRQERIQKRIDKLTATVGSKDDEIMELKKQLAEKPKEGLTEEEVERRAQALADAKLKDKLAEDEQKSFAKVADTLIKDASKIEKDFEKKINTVAEETGVKMPKYMVDILSDLDNNNGHEILAQMSNDADLYEELCELSERKMTQRLIRISDKLKEDGKKKPIKASTNLPDPIEPINDGNNNRGNSLPKNPTKDMDEYVRIRALQTAEARKRGKNVY